MKSKHRFHAHVITIRWWAWAADILPSIHSFENRNFIPAMDGTDLNS